MNFGLSDKVVEQMQKVFETNQKVDKVLVFGSRAKGNFKEASDIDIAIKGYDLTFDDILGLLRKLDELELVYEIDLINYNTIKEPALKEHIDRVGIEFYSRWKKYKFSELLIDESISYGIVQPGTHTEIDSVPIIRVNNIKNGHIMTDEIMKVSSSIEDKYLRTRLVGGELLITVVGSVGECAIVPENLKGWNVARAVSVARIKKGFDVKFIKYAFKTDDIIFQMYGNTNDTVQPTLNLSLLKELKFTLPSFFEQTAIASILSSLDDKIDLLHRQNKTLEQLAETLFRQWFIIDAKEDWQEKSILDFPNLSLLKPGIIPFEGEKIYLATADIQGKEIVNAKIKITFANRPSRANMQPIINSIWFAKMNESPKYLLIDSISKDYTEKYILSTGFYGIHAKTGLYFIWNFFNTDDFENQKSSNISGSVMEALNSEGLKGITLKLPPFDSILDFENKVTPYYQKISNNNSQILTLNQLRNTLLPKLMSGEVRVTL